MHDGVGRPSSRTLAAFRNFAQWPHPERETQLQGHQQEQHSENYRNSDECGRIAIRSPRALVRQHLVGGRHRALHYTAMASMRFEGMCPLFSRHSSLFR